MPPASIFALADSLIAVAIPSLERLQKEGEEGRKKLASITRFVTVALGVLQSFAYYFYLRTITSAWKTASKPVN